MRYRRRMGDEEAEARWTRYRRALEGQPLPAALVDLDALDENIARLTAPVRAAGKKLRLATKSIRCPALHDYIAARAADVVGGLMTYAASESAWLAERGARDLLLAYPTVQASDAAFLLHANRDATCAVVVDSDEQLAALASVAVGGARIPVIIEVDLAYRPIGSLVNLGVRRSPLRTAAQVVALAERVRDTPGLKFHGVMGYEAHIAGLTDRSPFSSWQNLPRRGLKRLSRPIVARTRAEIVRALGERGLAPEVVNGGGTGSVHWTSAEDALTEVTVGSGFLDSQLFDYYSALNLQPAAYFALQAVRRPAPGLVTCHGGGFIASGDGGPDRLPRPSLPAGCRLLPLEGAGEVQTPVRLPPGVDVRLGDPIFFRHAKAGELAEHFNEYLLVRGDRIEARAPTYRGLGQCFLG
jgi:D-serine deaminase-like pyridoxal phosphate-dependent protein